MGRLREAMRAYNSCYKQKHRQPYIGCLREYKKAVRVAKRKLEGFRKTRQDNIISSFLQTFGGRGTVYLQGTGEFWSRLSD